VFENRALRKVFGRKTEGITGERRKLHNEELHNLYCSPNIIRMIKSKTLRLARRDMHLGFWRENATEKDNLEDKDICRRILLKRLFK
jgi:hypothetical protein